MRRPAASTSSTPTCSASRSTSRRSRSWRRRSRPRETVLVRAGDAPSATPARSASRGRRAIGSRLPNDRLTAQFDDDSTLRLTPELVGPSKTHSRGVIGEGVDLTLVHTNRVRRNTLLYHLTKHLLEKHWRDPNEDPRLYLFGRADADGAPVARRASGVRGRNLPRATDVPRTGGHGVPADHRRHSRGAPRQPADDRRARCLQPGRFDPSRAVRDVEDDPVGDGRGPLPRQLGRLRQRLGKRSSAASPRRIRACGRT